MSDFPEHGDGLKEIPGFSLCKAMEDLSQAGLTQNEALKEKQKTLSSLQTTLSDVEKKGEAAKQEHRIIVREMLIVEGDLEHLEKQIEVLHDRCASISTENTEMQSLISEEEENARLALAGFDTYRKKMEGHRMAVLHAVSQTEAHKMLEEKKEMVRMLMQEKEQLRLDLENPDGNTAQMAKKETNALKREISEKRTMIADKTGKLKKELDVHSQLKKDIEIQNRRHEAIIKRLRCQLSRAQAGHRQMFDEICHLQSQLAELKGQSSQESVVSDN
ncbi:coiled-coil domain-containing protein 122-like [Cololabis saira]|uniref:coiled-coil domain-containing protein 122-like n=1 Tax=Cololabis saira TaxID=129043 RepID=UPI002AD1EA92|nr:coiled-coil domain-containing protein 122-like [Cololabis saira]